jgi:hypothetical protein
VNARDILAQLRLPDGRLWVDAAEDFQIEDAQAVLEGPQPYNFLTRSRGSSKTGDLSAVALALLLSVDTPERLYWLAADSGQGTLAIDSIDGYARRTQGLASQIEVFNREVRAPRSGARLEVLPADAPGAWGLNPFAVFVDELANWTDGPAAKRLWEASSSSVAKRPDARLVVLTTASTPDHFARKVLDHAEGSELWRVNEVRGPAPWADPERIREQKARLPDAVFRQLFQNEWTAAEGAFLDPGVVDSAFVLEGAQPPRRGQSYVAGLDLGTVHDRTVFAVGHRDGDFVHLDRMQTWKGSRLRPVVFDEIERFIVAAHGMFRFHLRFDPWQSLDLAQRLRRQGIRADVYNYGEASKQRLAATLLQSLNAGHLKLYEADGLRDELLGLRLKQNPSGAWSFDHQRSGHDDRAQALALMIVTALEAPIGEPATGTKFHPWGSKGQKSASKQRPPRAWASGRGQVAQPTSKPRPWFEGLSGQEVLTRIRQEAGGDTK